MCLVLKLPGIGEVLRWSTDSDKEEMTDRREDITIESDTIASTPDCCKSPDMVPLRVPVDILRVGSFDVQATQEKRQFIYEGVSSVKETEVQESDGDSEDNVPIAAVLRKKKECTSSLTLEQIQDCEVGPKDDKAVGVTVAKIFDGVEYLIADGALDGTLLPMVP